jgi:chromatin segregation and condensation protein Rec8/ScpA/Scc1 (kleisin family)
VTQETLLATIGRPSTTQRARGRAPQSRSATPSPFAKLDSDPLEDYCLAFLLQYHELAESVEDLRSEYFRRLENREIFDQLTRRWERQSQFDKGAATLASLEAEIDQELAEHLVSLVNKVLPPLEERRRLGAFQDAIHRLEERYLRELKTEEEIRFTEAPPDLQEEFHAGILQVNQRLRTNQSKRSSLMQDISNRG